MAYQDDLLKAMESAGDKLGEPTQMKKFRTYFYSRSSLMKFSATVYAVVLVVMVAFLLLHHEVFLSRINLLLAYGFFVACSLFMFLRALIFIYETIEIDEIKHELRFRLLRKTISFKDITHIKRVRAGQLRIITSRGLVWPVSSRMKMDSYVC